MKKFMVICMSMILMLSISSVSFADNDGLKVASGQEIENETEFTTLDNTPINDVHHVSRSAFENTFSLSPSNGKELNVFVKNNHRSKTVKFKVEHIGYKDHGYVEVGPGEGRTRNFTMNSGGGMSGKWKVYVTSSDGHEMDINVSARQF
ncbi:hypothetical protein [Paenibacillus apiarius]|uniref:hypothetical protein n=1 Tax=Paenibacillus apiarius TaxID=46240 RepID=UPI00197E8069|nr:hypothetical protein [Paenibacillus apiarius]MBN3523310.1 hypothetical protein [Paenibacillus apiarius]